MAFSLTKQHLDIRARIWLKCNKEDDDS